MLEKVAHDNGMSVAEDVTIGLTHPLGQGLKSSVIPGFTDRSRVSQMVGTVDPSRVRPGLSGIYWTPAHVYNLISRVQSRRFSDGEGHQQGTQGAPLQFSRFFRQRGTQESPLFSELASFGLGYMKTLSSQGRLKNPCFLDNYKNPFLKINPCF